MTSLINNGGGANTAALLFDKLYGSKQVTAGAEIQRPRKVPMRVEPKSYFANERTYLSWMGMAITMGGVSSALVGFSGEPDDGTEHLISKRTIDIITCIYTPLSILIMCYALFTYEWRSKFMRTKQLGFFDDKVGPITVAVLVLLTLLVIFTIALMDYLF
ncbi:Vacuolar transporter chaperone 1 [Tetrabaena socialis]|uniref:Vacuolar transporter chaperone 1 n=1 Tax=Tetrabaena socialis TaxID=47790 RepID=A0A2J7ZTG5_9CHLO|nr:Vacuolar transporter chaperone 1 [Tetrabaena socialis]|eukprot:PNH03530.1 Vacuolar transporter chaperone 1 [Tetrabaena socialis]